MKTVYLHGFWSKSIYLECFWTVYLQGHLQTACCFVKSKYPNNYNLYLNEKSVMVAFSFFPLFTPPFIVDRGKPWRYNGFKFFLKEHFTFYKFL